MSDYTQVNNFSAKDDLPAGTGGEKFINGQEWDDEFGAISTAVATKYDSGDLSDEATAETGTSNTVLLTPLRTTQYIKGNSLWMGLRQDVLGERASSSLEVHSSYAVSSALAGFTILATKTYLMRGIITLGSTAGTVAGFETTTATPSVIAIKTRSFANTASAQNGIVGDPNGTANLGMTADTTYEVLGVLVGHATLDTTLDFYFGVSGFTTSLVANSYLELIQLD